jgi:CDP-diacylglycerol--glycerol-3-phosphate 3-phosphatidyltransferase
MKHKLTLANALSALRIILSVALLAPPALSPTFLALYATAGLTDMLDGFVARQTKTESEFGAKLDSAADLTFTVVSLAKILPTVAAPAWLWAWVAAIAVVKVANVVSGLVMRKRLVMPHTVVNKVAGFVAFLVLFAIPTFGVVAPSIPACVVTTFAAVQESHLIRTGHN